jgi:hypothetical protein
MPSSSSRQWLRPRSPSQIRMARSPRCCRVRPKKPTGLMPGWCFTRLFRQSSGVEASHTLRFGAGALRLITLMYVAAVDDLSPRSLTWAEVDPDQHPFATEGLEALIAPLVPKVKPSEDDREDDSRWEDAITRALVGRYGRWACGWRWARGEGSVGGGVIQAWCCPSHSLSTPEETAKRAADGLLEWRAWLELLATRFAQFSTKGHSDSTKSLQLAAARLITDVVERTDACDAWYGHCSQVLGWYLERGGSDTARAQELIQKAIGGRFESWIAPKKSIVTQIARQVASDAARDSRDHE